MNPTRRLVSMNRKRYEEDGFSLDLAYITPQIIAMGFPATGVESLYRNKYSEALRFLDEKHKDHYKVYNLCSESSHQYTNDFFHGKCASFPFPDHNPPPFDLIHSFCVDADIFLKSDQNNVVAIHCKAGKGRTGVMISALLMYRNFKPTALECLGFYGAQRDKKSQGVTIPSQRRYIEYYEQFLRNHKKLDVSSGETISLSDGSDIAIDTVAEDVVDRSCDKRVFRVMSLTVNYMFPSTKSLEAVVSVNDVPVFSGKLILSKVIKDPEGPNEDNIFTNGSIVVSKKAKGITNPTINNDVKLAIYSNGSSLGDIWFNTNFITIPKSEHPCYVKLEFTKQMIDKIARDKKNKKTPKEYRVSLILKLIG